MAFDEPEVAGGDGQDEKSSRGAWAAGAVLGIVVLLAAWVAWPRDDDDLPTARDGAGQDGGAATPSPDVSTSADGNGADVDVDEGDCPELPDGDEIPEAGPDVTWEIFFAGALPFSEEHGPAVLEGDVARCFSHTPTGALIAAVQIEYRTVLARGGVEVARQQTVPGEGQDRLVEALEERGWEPPTPGEICQTAGFRFVTYTATEAVIAIAARCPGSGSMQLTEARLRWMGGDWRREVEPDGSFSPTASALVDLTGMVEWGGV